jgi:outer membrane protein TolC
MTPMAIMMFLIALAPGLFAQKSFEPIFQLPDSVKPLTIDQFYRIILDHHPIVKQSALLTESARQEIRLARGAFDPKLTFLLERKEFQDKTYYDLRDGYLYFPTRSPILPKIGYEQNSGERLDPSISIPGEIQYFAGVTLPIGRGLLTDERRTELKQAEFFQNMAEAEQVKMINKVLLSAAKEYWQWYHAYYHYRLLARGADVASEIYRRVRLNYELGEASPLDTVQARITMQSRLVELQEGRLQFLNAGVLLSNYLWDDQGLPLQLSANVGPVFGGKDIPLDLQTISALTDQARTNHPELIKLRGKVGQLRADQFLAKEFMKPRLDLHYTLLAQPSADRLISPTNDYKLGLDFSMPLFLRKERSKLALTELKLRNINWEQTLVEREILNEITANFYALHNTKTILAQQITMVDLYDRMLEGELINLENGESDLFKINIQQEKLLQSQAKLLKLQSEYEKMKAELYWSAGVRNLGMN